jgi:hypothetical protein
MEAKRKLNRGGPDRAALYANCGSEFTNAEAAGSPRTIAMPLETVRASFIEPMLLLPTTSFTKAADGNAQNIDKNC